LLTFNYFIQNFYHIRGHTSGILNHNRFMLEFDRFIEKLAFKGHLFCNIYVTGTVLILWFSVYFPGLEFLFSLPK
jgi:hypothetical protein